MSTRQWMLRASCLLLLGDGSAFADTQCTLQFTMRSWSFIYKSSKGQGTVTCNNGQHARVRLRAHGGGLTVGVNKTLAGRGTFTHTASITDVFGTYGGVDAHGGAGDSGGSRALVKGDVGLTITGTGKGVNAGIDVGSFTITRIK